MAQPAQMFDRVPPQNIDAERAVLGACLINPDAVDRVVSIIGDDWQDVFYIEAHKRIYGAIYDLYRRATPVDTVTVYSELTTQGTIEQAGGASYLGELQSSFGCSANVDHYAKIVLDLSAHRRIILACSTLAQQAYEGTLDGTLESTLSTFERERAQIEGTTSKPYTLTGMQDDWNHIDIPDRKFALYPAFPMGAVTVLHAMGGLGKSMLILVSMVSRAIGRTLIKGWECTAPASALYVALEDDIPEIQKRLQKIAHVYQLTDYECALVAGNLKILTPIGGMDFFQLASQNVVVPGPDYLRLRQSLSKAEFSMVVLDPKSALLGGALDENANPLGQKAVNLLTALAGQFTAIVLIDHVAKADRDTSISARGGGSWTDAARQAWALRPLNKAETNAANSEYDPKMLMALELRKSNWTGPQDTKYLVRRSGPDSAGVMECVDLQSKSQAMLQSEMGLLQDAVIRVISENETTRSQLCGNTSGASYKRGSQLRNMIAEHANTKIGLESIRSLVNTMISEGSLFQEGGQNVLRATHKPIVEEEGEDELPF